EIGSIPDEKEIHKKIRVRPELSLDFPESDITSIKKIQGDPGFYVITATFLGLYGTSSPLPTFYTEDLLQEKLDERTITRDFIDIINAPLYYIVFKIWSKYRLFYKIVEQREQETLQKLYCLLGLGEKELQKQVEDSYSLLRFIGLATQFPRSAEGLRVLLSDRLHEPSIRIIQCVPRIVVIPQDQRFILGIRGNKLGVNSYLGREILDRTGKFRIQAGPFSGRSFHSLLPDRAAYKKITQLVRFYLDKPLVWDMKLFVHGDSIKTAQLGSSRWSQLGWNSWIFSGQLQPGTTSVTLTVPEVMKS
ncbi:MAG TPA: type VI secretion system baseplate subunit TssG, partial [Anaerolineae bacterium]|nr:type VI secretion system baseplate subunit TssG [Anaerolineae bacterium]